MCDNDCQIGDDTDSLTAMSEACLIWDNTLSQRGASYMSNLLLTTI